MERILVMGRSGSGKSLLARKLGDKFDLPVFHMDRLFWLPFWVERPKTDMVVDVEKILADHKRWVIDGNYKRVALEPRIRASDLIIILDFGFLVSIWRVLKRNIIHWNKTRPDMQDDCVERFNFEFVKYIWTYPKRTLRPIENYLVSFPEKSVLRFYSRRSLDRWLKSR